VDQVHLFDERRPLALIKYVRPDVYVRGSDHMYVDSPEVRLVLEQGGRVVNHPTTVNCDRVKLSTGAIVNRIRERYGALCSTTSLSSGM
jgi:bifunctional ADP-heptose synthase (sugar kinase/adenylyltransferase)